MRPSIDVSLGIAPGTSSPVALWSDGGQAQRYDSDGNRRFYADLVARLLEGAPTIAGRGLDLGCGSGFACEVLTCTRPQVAWHGVDVSAPMLARAGHKPLLSGVRLCRAAAESLPYGDRAFDVVVSNFSWHWFAPAAAAEVARVLRPGGWLLVCAPLRHFSQADGNRWLARRLLARRHSFRRMGSQGLRLEDLPRLLPVPLRPARLQQIVIEESFSDARSLLATLQSRGALQAIFGADHEQVAAEMPDGPLTFEWPIGLLHAQVG